MKKSETSKKSKNRPLSEMADKNDLYERSVQCAESEIGFIDRHYEILRKRKAKKLREDFCGSALVSFEWVARRKDNESIAVDIDPEVMNWGISRHMGSLNRSQKNRIQFLEEDVIKVRTAPQDVILATNFSYWCFKERRTLLSYFESVRKSLATDGVFFVDCYGGYEAYRLLEEKTEHEGFTYIWDQADFNPINNHQLCYIHFSFPDGSRIERAFSYNWRLWTIGEIRELMSEAGFSQSLVFWQDWDESEEAESGEFTMVEKAEPDAGWIAYVAALR